MSGYAWISACLAHNGRIQIDIVGKYWAYTLLNECVPKPYWESKKYNTRHEAAEDYCRHFGLEFEARALWEARNSDAEV